MDTQRAMPASFILRNANVLDESGGFGERLDVAVENGIISEVGGDVTLPDAPSIDFADRWLMPGVFDCHLHIASSSLDAMELMRTPITQWALETARNMRKTLECGVTFVRDAGGADAGMRDSIARGYVPGPRLQVAVVAMSQTGGHIDGFLPGPGFEMSADYVIPDFPGRPPCVVDGIDDMRKVVRETLRAGADWIKLCTTGGILSAHDDGDIPEFTIEEIEVAVFEAERRGKGVMVHAFGGEGIDNAIEAGVRTIEHGIFLTDEQAKRMAAAGVSLVPTLAVIRDVMRWAKAGLVPDYAVEKALAIEPRHRRRRAHREGARRPHRARHRLRRARRARSQPRGDLAHARGRSHARGSAARRHDPRRGAVRRRRSLRPHRSGLRVRRHRARPGSERPLDLRRARCRRQRLQGRRGGAAGSAPHQRGQPGVSELELTPERREELARDFEAVEGWKRDLAEFDLDDHDPLLTPATDDP